MGADDGKQGQSTHIGNEVRQHAATFVGQAVQRWMNSGRITRIGAAAQKRLHQTPQTLGLTLYWWRFSHRSAASSLSVSKRGRGIFLRRVNDGLQSRTG